MTNNAVRKFSFPKPSMPQALRPEQFLQQGPPQFGRGQKGSQRGIDWSFDFNADFHAIFQARILVTNASNYWRQADKVLFIRNGSIANLGTYDDLFKNNDFIATMVESAQVKSKGKSPQKPRVKRLAASKYKKFASLELMRTLSARVGSTALSVSR